MKMLIAAAMGVLAAWLYRSERAREEVRRRFSTTPESVRRATSSVASTAAQQAGRAAEVIEGSPLPDSVKDTVSRATTTVQAAAEKVSGAAAGVPSGIATLSVQEMPDGSWIGNAAWGGRTLTDGATEPDLVIRRLATRLAGMSPVGGPPTIKLTRVPREGEREERETDLASLLE
jgi:hypothetical protein